MEGRLRHNAGTSLKDYLAVIARKTASLFAAGGKDVADLAGAPQADHRHDAASRATRSEWLSR